MKVGFFTPHIKWCSHQETELELMQLHLNKGDQVVQFVCNAELPICDTNIDHNVTFCLSCIGCRQSGDKLIEGRYVQTSITNLTDEDKEEISRICRLEFSTIKDLQKLRIENFDIGYAVASSVISLKRDPAPDMKKNRHVIQKYLASSLGIYRSIINFLTKTPLDRIYVFNGRLAHVKPVLRACQAMKTDCYVHERGANIDRYALFENTTPHDRVYMEKEIRTAWEQANHEERKKAGEAFFIERSKGIERDWFSFTKEQVAGLLPNDWDAKKQNVVIFNSSEDEFASIGEDWANPIYTTQLEGLQRIIRDLNGVDDIHLYLRVHPNLNGVDNEETRALYELEGDNFTLIPAESSVSTYDLLRAATKVVSFGSTVGIEAVYWEKPSILAGIHYYNNFGGTYNATSHEDLLQLIQSDLKPKNVEAALMYGYFFRTFGIPFTYYKAESFLRGTFKGKYLAKSKPRHAFLYWLLYKPGIRKFQRKIGSLHSRYLLNSKYLAGKHEIN